MVCMTKKEKGETDEGDKWRKKKEKKSEQIESFDSHIHSSLLKKLIAGLLIDWRAPLTPICRIGTCNMKRKYGHHIFFLLLF